MSLVNETVVLGSNDHANKFSIRFMELLREKELVDVILVADGQSFPVHRLILSALSPSFRNMFKQMPVNQQAYGLFILIYGFHPVNKCLPKFLFHFVFVQCS